MWFRILLAIVALGLWTITLWLTTHTSENAQVLSRYSNGYFALLVMFFSLSVTFSVLLFGAAYRWAHKKRNDLVLLAVSGVISLGLVEISVRALDPMGISYYQHTANYHLEKVADDEMYYRHAPSIERIYQGVTVRTNPRGLRGAPVAKKSPDEYRIMFLGDSVTFGWGAREEDTFVHRIGEILQNNLRRPVSTINTGVGSYNTDNQYALLRHFGEELQPDSVVLVYLRNDVIPTPEEPFNPASHDKTPSEKVLAILGKSWAFRLASHVFRYRGAARSGRLDKTSVGWQQSVTALQGIADYCKAKGIPLFVVKFRMISTPMDDDIASQLAQLSETLNFYYSDTLPWFRDKNIQSLIHSPVDSHPNAEGHAILAKGIADLLQQAPIFK